MVSNAENRTIVRFSAAKWIEKRERKEE